MISERQDNNSIYHWLAQWLRDGALIPKEAVCDFSLALLSALVRAFTRYNTLEAYLGECSKILCNPEKFSPPECFVRCDVAHAVKLIASWPPMRDQKNYRVRNLYIRSMAQVIQATSIDDVKSLLTSIITVALSPFEGVDKITGEATHCETAKEKLKRRIATGFSDMEDNLSRAIDIEKSGIASEDLGNLNTESSRNEEVGHNSFQSWAESIVHTCKKSIVTLDGDHDNLQYLPDLVPCIVKLCRLLPMWSALLVPFFGYGGNTASSAPVESSFNDLKNRVLSHKKLPMRADDFLETHINSLEGTMKLIAAKSVQNPYSDETHEKESVLVSSQEENINDFPRNSESSEKTRGENYGDIPETEFSVQGNNVNKKIGEANPKKSHVPNLHITSCPACIDGNFPTGAHRCIKCKIPVHIFPECSVSISSSEEGKEEEEGYGQGRTCRKCSTRSTNTTKLHFYGNERDSHENWRGLGIPPKKRPRSSYLEPNKELMDMNLKTNVTAKTIGLLKNGNRASELKPIKFKGIECKITLQNTCSFDSLVQLLACEFCDSKQYSHFVKLANDNRIFWDIVQNIVEVGVSIKVYRQRARVLESIFSTTKLPSGLTLLSTESTINNLTEKLMNGYPSVIESSLCSRKSCQDNSIFRRTVLSIVMHENNMDELERLILFSLSVGTETCSKVDKKTSAPCNGQKNVRHELSPNHLLLEVSVLNQSNNVLEYDISPDFNIKLSNIPSTLTVFEKIYTLRGAVGFYGSHSNKNFNVIGHYVAFCRRLNNQWEIYNDISNKKENCKNSDVINCQFLLYTI